MMFLIICVSCAYPVVSKMCVKLAFNAIMCQRVNIWERQCSFMLS